MERTSLLAAPVWPMALLDPSGRREAKPRTKGCTMVLDKGIGMYAFEDLLATTGDYIDIIKLGFGTASLYPLSIIRDKIQLAIKNNITIMPGGTLLEAAVNTNQISEFFRQIVSLGFTGVEVSDGTINLQRSQRSELIRNARSLGLTVYSEYGKKLPGSRIDVHDLAATVELDIACGAELVTVEARESGLGIGLFDENGACRTEELSQIVEDISDTRQILWEAPRKDQQVALIKALGPEVNLGNIPVHDVLALETMRRGLRSDTFDLHQAPVVEYMI